jgi:hypothetical protein
MEGCVMGDENPGVVECVVCNRPFIKKQPHQKYCHWQCQAARKQGREFARRQLVASSADGWLIDGDGEREKPGKHCPKKIPTGRYVYAWFNDESDLPFYVGKGVDDRAWRRHVDQDGRSMWCQQVRVTSSCFRVEVIRDNLTNEGAMLVEASLIAFVRFCGGLLANQAEPLSRQERPPVELNASLHPGEMQWSITSREKP